jgi:hypothetical protein
MTTRSRRTPSALAVAATACLAAATIPATPAFGDDTSRTNHPPKSIPVTGLLTLQDADKGVYRATGDLEGTWVIPPDRAKDYYDAPTVLIQEGTEWFKGCVAATRSCGTLNSDYISWSYLRADKRLISGGCVHAPTGGTRGFRGVRGLITMTDTPVGTDVNTVYQGDLVLHAERDEGEKPVPTTPGAALATRTLAASAGTC